MGGHGQKFMLDDLIKQLANQIRAIDDGVRKQYILIDRETGVMTSQPLQ
jgi:hypothetical protein